MKEANTIEIIKGTGFLHVIKKFCEYAFNRSFEHYNSEKEIIESLSESEKKSNHLMKDILDNLGILSVCYILGVFSGTANWYKSKAQLAYAVLPFFEPSLNHPTLQWCSYSDPEPRIVVQTTWDYGINKISLDTFLHYQNSNKDKISHYCNGSFYTLNWSAYQAVYAALSGHKDSYSLVVRSVYNIARKGEQHAVLFDKEEEKIAKIMRIYM